MIVAYLWLNAVLYVGFAAWCSLSPAATARAAGFVELTAGGRSEYLVVYGGLQLGLGFVFAYLAAQGMQRLGLLFALTVTVPLVVFRVISAVRDGPLPGTTLGLAALELGLALAGAALWFWQRPA